MLSLRDKQKEDRNRKNVNQKLVFINFFLKILFIHERQRQRDRDREMQRHRQREKQAPSKEPDVGLDPGTPGSYPGLKAALNH